MIYNMEMFPIMIRSDRYDNSTIAIARKAGTPYVAVCLPLEMIAPHEKQAQRNHGQTLKRLAERGGLSACEALAVLEDRQYRSMDHAKANEALCRAIATWVDAQVALVTDATADQVTAKTGLDAHQTHLGALVEQPPESNTEKMLDDLARIMTRHELRCRCGSRAIIHYPNCPMALAVT